MVSDSQKPKTEVIREVGLGVAIRLLPFQMLWCENFSYRATSDSGVDSRPSTKAEVIREVGLGVIIRLWPFQMLWCENFSYQVKTTAVSI